MFEEYYIVVSGLRSNSLTVERNNKVIENIVGEN